MGKGRGGGGVMVQKRDAAQGLIAGGVAGSLTGILSTLLLNRPAMAAPEDSKEALDYLIKLGELQAQALARLVEIAEIYPGVPGLPPTADLRTSTILRAQFFTDPEAACSLINSHQPNLVRGAPIAINVALGPFGTTTLATALTAGWIHIFTTADFFTDIPFAVTATVLMDGSLWYFDTGLCPVSYRWKSWQETTSQWQVILTNTTALNVNLHAYLGGWDIEAQTFNRIKNAIKPLSYALAEYGSPDGGA